MGREDASLNWVVQKRQGRGSGVTTGPPWRYLGLGYPQPRQGRGPGQVGVQGCLCPNEGWPEADLSPLLALGSGCTKRLSPRRDQVPVKDEWSNHSSKWDRRAHNPRAKLRSQKRCKATGQRSASLRKLPPRPAAQLKPPGPPLTTGTGIQ